MLYFAVRSELNEYDQLESVRIGSAKKTEQAAINVLKNKRVSGYVVNERNITVSALKNGEVIQC